MCCAKAAGFAGRALHLDRLSGPGILRPLIHRGGLRVDALTDGEIGRGASIVPI